MKHLTIISYLTLFLVVSCYYQENDNKLGERCIKMPSQWCTDECLTRHEYSGNTKSQIDTGIINNCHELGKNACFKKRISGSYNEYFWDKDLECTTLSLNK